MTTPSPERLKVLWEKGRNYFTTFFIELEQVRNAFGNDGEFGSWCIHDLHIGPDALVTVSKVLRKSEAERVRSDMSLERDKARAQRRAKKEEERRLRAEEAARRALAKAQKKELAKRKNKQKSNALYRKRKKEEQLRLYATAVKDDKSLIDVKQLTRLPDDVLANSIKETQTMDLTLKENWINNKIKQAAYITAARVKYSADRQFGEWLQQHDIHFNRNELAALTSLGSNLTHMRQVLETTTRNSLQYIWRDVCNGKHLLPAA